MKKLFRCCVVGTLLLYLTACGGPREVSDMPYSLDYEGETLEGTYTGTTVEDLPSGEGTFTCTDKDVTFEYTGTWEEGKMVGEGELESNIYVLRIGEEEGIVTYKGSTYDGVASGQGQYTFVGSTGERHSYEGEFDAGLPDGEGKITTDSYVIEGTFDDGEYALTPAQYFVSVGTVLGEEYTVTENALKFLETNPNIFLENRTEGYDVQIDDGFSYASFAKNPDKYGGNLIQVSNLYVTHISEGLTLGEEHTFMILITNEGLESDVYYVNMYGFAEDIYEGSRVTLTALPLDYFTYTNTSDIKIWSIACAGVSVEEK